MAHLENATDLMMTTLTANLEFTCAMSEATAQNSNAQHGIAQHATAQHGLAQLATAWHSKKRKENYTFRHHLNEKPSTELGCPDGIARHATTHHSPEDWGWHVTLDPGLQQST